MGVVIISVLVGVVVGIIVYYRCNDFNVASLGFCSAMVVTAIIFGILAFAFETTPVKVSEQNIYALKDNSKTGGSFFLGIGNINEERCFFYVVNTEKGKRIETKLVDKSYIIETDDEAPKVVTYKKRYKSAIARFLYEDMNGEYEYRFYVPKNTITTEFEVDLE